MIGFDYALRRRVAIAGLAADEEVDLDFRMNLCELRSVLTESARIAQLPGPHGGHRAARRRRHRQGRPRPPVAACEMMLRGGGRLYLEILLARGADDPFAREEHLHVLAMRRVVDELEARGAVVVHRHRQRPAGTCRSPSTRARRFAGAPDRTVGGRMATVRSRFRTRGKQAARTLGMVRAGLQADAVEALQKRVSVLEDEVQECRQLNLRLAELTDVVQELLLPVAQRDEQRVDGAAREVLAGLVSR